MLAPDNKNITYRQEALRKATHFIALLIPTSYLIFPREWATASMAIAFSVVAAFEFFRLRRWLPWRLIEPCVGGMIRPKEQKGNFTGAFYILLAGTLTIAFFPRYVATTAIAFEILGDVASAMIGRKFGHHKIRGQKSFEGAAGFLAVALLIIVVMPKVPYTVGVAGAVVASLVEAISIHRDDNLTVPLSSGLVMYLMMTFWPGLP
ncbi:MAG: diacylglycerol/polyprenol kinase family protein [Candidatus Zixiibacteriota bacterium]